MNTSDTSPVEHSVIERLAKRYGFSLFLCSLIIAFFAGASGKQSARHALLAQQIDQLERQIEEALRQKEQLTLILENHSDPLYRERVMIKKLGVIPNGYLKVYFSTRESKRG